MKNHESKTKLTPDKYLSDEEYEELERVISKYYKTDFRNCLLIELSMRTGCRAQEVLNIRKEDLNYDQQSLYIRTLKNGIDRDIPLPKPLFNKLKKYAESVNTEKIFTIGYDNFRIIWDYYRPVKKKLHSLRHTAAIRFYKKSRDLRLVMYFLGHSNPNTTLIYLEFVERIEKMRKII